MGVLKWCPSRIVKMLPWIESHPQAAHHYTRSKTGEASPTTEPGVHVPTAQPAHIAPLTWG